MLLREWLTVHRLGWLTHPRVPAAIVVCLCVGLAIATYHRVGVWNSQQALWSDCVAKAPRKARAHLGLGEALRRGGNVDRAIAEFRAALDLARYDPRWIRQEIREELGAALLALGHAEEAVAVARAGLAEESDHAGLLGLVAMSELQRHDLAAAEASAELSVRSARAKSTRETADNEVNAGRHPATSLRVLGLVLLAQQRVDESTTAFEQAVRLDPDEAQGRLLLARTYRAQGRLEESCALLRGRFDGLQAQVHEAQSACPRQ